VTDLRETKRTLRKRAKAQRAEFVRQMPGDVPFRVQDHFLSALQPADGAVVAGYCPMGDELDCMPLLRTLHDRGHPCALPVVTGRGKPLTFRRWEPDMEMVAGGYGEQVPPPSSPELEPDLLLVPLLSFDRDGYRLGYGAGYYDRTLETLRSRKPITAAGLGYSAQQWMQVPRDENDQQLDWIVTELGAFRITE
jgi:5-formyltetrahydrofolate cyclo-ligase